MDLAVVVPMLNEAGNVEPLLREIAAALADVTDFEVVVVDDGSRDHTPQELSSALAEFPWLTVVTHRESRGQSTALRSGVLVTQAYWIATLDGDGQNDPADIPAMLNVAR